MRTPHKHAEIIKAWADGREIEYLWEGMWMTIPKNPMWPSESIYRIKPEPKPDVDLAYFVEDNTNDCDILPKVKWKGTWHLSNLKLTFDGETGALKSAEVLK